jgi:hypothetical protein
MGLIAVLRAAAAMVVLPASLIGCAAPDSGPGSQQVKERKESVTGSNIPRRDGRDTGVREADKDALESQIRNSTRNTGALPPQ